MDSIKKRFIQELESIEKLILFYDKESELLKQNEEANEVLTQFKEEFSGFYSQKRVFNYNSIIISLYGFFEKFIEDILLEYIDNANRIHTHYNKLPEAIHKSHFTLSIALLDKVQSPRYTGPLNKEIVIKNLHDSINLNENYQLNKEAFSQHTANFRLQVIDDVFLRIGILGVCDQVKKHAGFMSYYKLKHELNEDDVLTGDEVHVILNDLAERRNEVAHGVPSEILSNDILVDNIEYFKVFAHSLTDILNRNVYKLEIKEKGYKLGDITDIFSKGHVVCFKNNYKRISKGDYLYGSNSEHIERGEILSIQLDGDDIDTISDNEDCEIGVRLDMPFKKSFSLYSVWGV